MRRAPKEGPARRPLLIVSAWEPELAPLRALLRGRGGAAPLLAPVGVGLVEAAIGATRVLADTRPRAVVFIGTAGIYASPRDRRLVIGAAAVADRICLASASVARGEAYLPAPLPAAVDADAALAAALAGDDLPRAAVACPLGITRRPAAARRLATATGAALENLELFAVARACAAARVRFGAVLGLSNQVGPDAHAEWKAHAAGATGAAAAAIARWLAPVRSASKAPRRSASRD